MREKSKVQAILQAKCPHCREGNLFETGPYNLKKFAKMHEQCPNCKTTYTKEPRFFDGAMYVSYALNVGLFLVSAFIIYHLFEPESPNTYLFAIILEVILLYPLLFRYSRTFYLYAFGGHKYKGGLESNGK